MNDIDTELTRKVLETFLKNPANAYDFIELRKQMADSSETPIRKALKKTQTTFYTQSQL